MPRLTIDLAKIKHNASLIAELLKPHGVRLTGVTKACLGNELVAQAMLDGGAAGLADSRSDNIRNLRRHFQDADITFLRSPVTPDDACFDADYYFVSSFEQALSLMRMTPRRPLKLCLVLETGDGREGVPMVLASDEAARIAGMPDAIFAGLATNVACARNDLPVGGSIEAFNDAAGRIAWRLRHGRMERAGEDSSSLPVMSVGGSGLLQLLAGPEGDGVRQPGWGMSLFAPITELRCGEAVLLGRIPSGQAADLYLQGAHRDAFVLEGPVLEVYDKGGVNQALVGFGVQDTGGGELIPCQLGITQAGATSDYQAINCTSPGLRTRSLKVGETVRFLPAYYALVAAMTSPYVKKNFV